MKSFCVKQRKQTDCVSGTEEYVKTKNGRTIMKCKCSECGITKTRFVSNRQGSGLKDLRNKASNYLRLDETRNKIKSYGHKNLDRAVDYATMGVANKLKTGSGRKRRGKGLLLGKNSPFKNVPLIGAIL